MNVIELTKSIISSYPKISDFTNNINTDFTDSEISNSGLYSTGDSLISEDVLGGQKRQHNFVMYSNNQGFNDYERLSNSSFLLDLAYWLETVKGNEIEVEIDGKKKKGIVTGITTANGMQYAIPTGDINDGITYQIQIYTTYTLESED